MEGAFVGILDDKECVVGGIARYAVGWLLGVSECALVGDVTGHVVGKLVDL